jgi:streptogramin lyase
MKLDDGGYKNKSNGNLTNMILDKQGLIWFVNNHGSTPAAYRYNPDTDQIKEYSNFVNQDGITFTIGGDGGVRCVVEDLEGNMWLGTSAGPLVIEKDQIDSNNPVYTQVKVPRNDGTDYADYLLANIDINAIAIDGAGRKWFGTNGNGVYLISADNMTQIHHFTTDNSCILSNTVKSIAIIPTTGEVFFGTMSGLCSYVSDATKPNDEMTKDNVWAYPNPVNPDYTGPITITGLTLNADVKILSSNGVVINEGRSNGGTFVWDGCDKKGRRVASGVYMVATTTKDGQKGTVCKIAIIR